MGKEKGKPGVMMYFDMIPAYELLSYDQLGRLFLGIIRYAHDGTEPEDLDLITRSMWIIIKPNIDRDDENYHKKVENALRSVKKREARRKRINNFLAESGALEPGVRKTLQEMMIAEGEEEETSS